MDPFGVMDFSGASRGGGWMELWVPHFGRRQSDVMGCSGYYEDIFS